MELIGELFDKDLALSIQSDIESMSIRTSLSQQQVDGRVLYIILGEAASSEELHKAREYFRVKVGLPGAGQPMDPEWEKLRSNPMGLLTKLIIVLCVIVYLFSFSKEYKENIFESLFFALDFSRPWLLITPILLHFSFLHIIFNLLWFKDLGSAFEYTKGTAYLLYFVVVSAILSNYAQFLIGGAQFGGMSGVVYGLLGHLWVYSKTHAKSDFSLPKRDIMMMVGWYFLCLFGIIPNVANMAHGVGLGVGMLWGFFPLEKPTFSNLKYVLLSLFFCFGTYVFEIYY